MKLLDGVHLSGIIRREIAIRVMEHCSNQRRSPHLAAILVGNNPASQAYVRNKIKACEEVGFGSTLIKKPETTSEQEVLELIAELNQSKEIDGYIVQLPLPRHIDEEK